MISSSITENSNDEKQKGETINAVVKALQLSPLDTSRGGALSLPDNGINADISADLTGAAAVYQIYYHNGNPILKPSIR